MRWVVFGWVSGVLIWAATATAKPIPDYDRQYGDELRRIAPSEVATWEEANQARARSDHATAQRLYAKLFADVPGFVHAERRSCGELLMLARRDEALSACRDAVAKDASSANSGALAAALLDTPNGTTLQQGELDEAASLVDRAYQTDRDDVYLVQLQCQIAAAKKSVALLSDCSARLQQLAPDEPGAIYWIWLNALTHENWSEAQQLTAHAQAVGAPAKMVEHMKTATADARPWTNLAWHWMLIILGGWAALCSVLVLVGIVLSKLTLRTVESWNQHSAERSKTLRSVYRWVLVVCSALYYASLPLVLLSVFGSAGGLVYGMFMFGWVPIKLALITVLGAFATGVAVLKSVFFRPSDEAPGVRLELAREPELQATLREVAGQIGTRMVDTVYLTPDTNLSVFERKGGERCLVIGAAVLEGMPLDAFKAILAHEYGHFSNQDTAGGGFALSVRRSLLLMIIGIARSGHAVPWNPAWWFARGFYKIFLRVSQGASRLQEILADRHAAEAYGGAAFVTGLKHVIACGLGFEAHVNAEINQALKAKRPLQGLWSPPIAASDDPLKLSQALDRAPSPYDSHPAPSDRIRWVERMQRQPKVPPSSADAWSIFRDRAYKEQEMTLFIYQRLAEQGVRPANLTLLSKSEGPGS